MTGSDNSATVHWANWIAAMARTNTAGLLLRGLALVLRQQEAAPIMTVLIPGVDSTMADMASRSAHLMSNTEFFAAFSCSFTLQTASWQGVTPPPGLTSCVISTLCGRRWEALQWKQALTEGGGMGGRSIAKQWGLTPFYKMHSVMRTKLQSCWHMHPGSGLETSAMATSCAKALLTVGEYTILACSRTTLTVQFCRKHVKFHRQGQIIPHTATLEQLLQADGVTLTLSNQKNSQKNVALYYTNSGAGMCPILDFTSTEEAPICTFGRCN
eukprot:11035168-Ditylum_brightwellii.AAC.2